MSNVNVWVGMAYRDVEVIWVAYRNGGVIFFGGGGGGGGRAVRDVIDSKWRLHLRRWQ